MSYASVHIGEALPSSPLTCQQENGRVSVRIAAGTIDVWLTGTPAELQTFAEDLFATVFRLRDTSKVVGCEASPGLAAEPDTVEDAAASSTNHETVTL